MFVLDQERNREQEGDGVPEDIIDADNCTLSESLWSRYVYLKEEVDRRRLPEF